MSYYMNVNEKNILGPKKYVNQKGQTECVEFVRQVTNAPATELWARGINVKNAPLDQIHRGMAIATFDENGKYPTDANGKHAAIYIGQTTVGIQVFDQWNSQGEVLLRTIRFNNPGKRSNNADTFYVIE